MLEQHTVEECNDNHVAHGTNLKKDKPNFTKMHEEYKLAWREYPPPNKPRPMRLMEFIFTYSANLDN